MAYLQGGEKCGFACQIHDTRHAYEGSATVIVIQNIKSKKVALTSWRTPINQFAGPNKPTASHSQTRHMRLHAQSQRPSIPTNSIILATPRWAPQTSQSGQPYSLRPCGTVTSSHKTVLCRTNSSCLMICPGASKTNPKTEYINLCHLETRDTFCMSYATDHPTLGSRLG